MTDAGRPAYPPLRVNLGARSYDIHAGVGLLERIAGLIRETVPASRAVVVTATGGERVYGARVANLLRQSGLATELLAVRSGERSKSLATARRLYDGLLAHQMDRSGVVVAVGGGVVCDLAGFVAATYMRGIRLVLVPTTLLAQVDAGIGGKTAVNLPQGKNLVGVFHQPSLVVVDTSTLRTLPRRQVLSGLAELLKHGFIKNSSLVEDTLLVADAVRRGEPEALTDLVRRSLEIKAGVVSADERETGLRAILNFGHTVGHALETLGGYRRWTHGEAVAMGMVAACRIGEEVRHTPPNVTSWVSEALRRVNLPVTLPRDVDRAELLAVMKTDKKSRDGIVRFVLLRQPGEAEYGVPVTEEVLMSVLERCRGDEKKP